MAANGAGGVGPPPAGGGGLPVPDLRTMEEPDESLFEAWERYKLSIDQCLNHNMLPVTQIDTFYNGLTLRHRDTINAAAGGTFMKRRPEECYDLIKNMTAHHNDWDTSAQRNESSSSITSSNPEIASLKLQMEEMNRNFTRMLQTNQQVNTVTPSCETCGGPHSYNDCPATVGQNQNVYARGAYNQGGNSYQPQGNRNLLSYRSDNYLGPPGFNVNQNQNWSNQNQNNQVQNYQAPNTQPPVALQQELINYIRINENRINSMQTQMNNLATSNQRLESMLGELKAITTRSGLVLDEPSVPMPHPFINPEEDEREEEILTDQDNSEFTIKLKYKALADLGASINLMPLSVWKELGLPKLIPTQMTLELANGDICTPKGIARDVFIPVAKFTFPADFVIVDYESDPCVPLILGRPFLRAARALIDVHGEEMILRDGNERLILNMRNYTSSYSNEPHQESINMIDVYNVSHEEIREDLFAANHPSGNPTSLVSYHTNLTSPEVNDDIFDPEEEIIENFLNLDKTKDLPPYHDNQLSGNPTLISEPETKSSSSSPTLISLEESELIWEEFKAYLTSDSFPPGNSNPSSPFHNSLSGSTTSSSSSLHISETSNYFLKEFTDELAHITFPPGNDDLPFDDESDLL
ncbi:reverse transcriptase domain-containing protein [Tanacetum coccineum]